MKRGNSELFPRFMISARVEFSTRSSSLQTLDRATRNTSGFLLKLNSNHP
jgi:hypothetical protein